MEKLIELLEKNQWRPKKIRPRKQYFRGPRVVTQSTFNNNSNEQNKAKRKEAVRRAKASNMPYLPLIPITKQKKK